MKECSNIVTLSLCFNSQFYLNKCGFYAIPLQRTLLCSKPICAGVRLVYLQVPQPLHFFCSFCWVEKIRGRYVYSFFARSCGKDTIDVKYEEARVAMTR